MAVAIGERAAVAATMAVVGCRFVASCSRGVVGVAEAVAAIIATPIATAVNGMVIRCCSSNVSMTCAVTNWLLPLHHIRGMEKQDLRAGALKLE